MAKVTIEEISRQTGLSRGTVSRALNDRPDINEQTKQRVLEVCRRLNYVPSRAARSLATGRHYALAIVMGPPAGAGAADMLAGAARRAARDKYALQFVHLEESAEQQSAALLALAHDRIDGVLLAGDLGEGPLARFGEDGGDRPAIVSTTPLPGLACDVVGPDERESGRLAARHALRGAGPRDTVYVHQPGPLSAEARLEGFREVCAAAGMDPAEAVFVLPTFEDERAMAWAAGGELRSRLSTASRVVASDDLTALNVMLACAGLGRLVGRDIAVVGQGNERFGREVSPGLTTTDCNGEEIGRRAIEMLIARADGTRMDAPQRVEIAPELVKRGSSQSLA